MKFIRKEVRKKDKLIVIERDKLKCIQCEVDIKYNTNSKHQPSLIKAHFHHIIPQVYKGTNTHPNICLLCEPCHNLVHSGEELEEKYFLMFEVFKRSGKLWI